MLAHLICFFFAKTFRLYKQFADECAGIVKRYPFREILSHKIKSRRNAVDRVLLYIKDGFGDFKRALVKFLAPKPLFCLGEIFRVKNMAVKSESEENCGDVKTWNAQKMRVERVNLTKLTHFLVFGAVSRGEPEMINLTAALIKFSEAEHPLLCKTACMPEPELFDQHGKWPHPEIDKIQINFDLLRCKRNLFVERMVNMHDRNVQNVKFLEILQKEKFFENRSKAFEIGNKTRRPKKHTRVSNERIKRFERFVVVDSWFHGNKRHRSKIIVENAGKFYGRPCYL